MFSELIEELKSKIVAGVTGIADIDTLNQLEDMYQEISDKLEIFGNTCLDESEIMESKENGRIHIDSINIYMSHEK